MGGILGLPSGAEASAQYYKTHVAAANVNDAKAVQYNAQKRVDSMKQPGDVVPYSAAQNYTQQGHMTTVAVKVGSILDITA